MDRVNVDKYRHIDIGYFMKYIIKLETIKIVNCPTESIVAGLLTKPLKGILFRSMREVIVECKHTIIIQE